MAIYVRNEKGQLAPLEIPAINGENGIAPNIQIGTTTTLESNEQATVENVGTKENLILNFGVPKGEGGGSSIALDDTTVSSSKAWSSSKIEDFVLNNDNVVWLDTSGENLKIDSTKEGYLREVEIFGNTWQDSDSKNLIPSLELGSVNNAGICEESTLMCRPKDFISCEKNTSYVFSSNGVGYKVVMEYDSLKTFIKYHAIGTNNNQAFVTSENTSYLKFRYKFDNDSIDTVKLQLEKGTVATSYVPFHKADLSDIKHLGELYVDELGQPILDDLGREQYKIEIESNDSLILYNNGIIADIKIDSNATFEETYLNFNHSHNSSVSTNREYTLYKGDTVFAKIISEKDSNSNYNASIKKTGGGTLVLKDKKTVVEEVNKYGYSIISYTHNSDSPLTTKFCVSNYFGTMRVSEIGILSNINTSDFNNFGFKQYKTSLLLPCQLSKIGDYSDRLYWDSEKSRYVVEKNVVKHYVKPVILNEYTSKDTESHKLYYYRYDNLTSSTFSGNGNVCGYSNFGKVLSNTSGVATVYNNNRNEMYVRKDYTYIIINREIGESKETAKNYFDTNEVYYYVKTDMPQLIETNITEQLKLPTYIGATYITISGGLQGTIKAKVPVDSNSALNTLIQENKDLKAINEEQDKIMNISLMAMDEIFTMLEPLLDTTVLGEESGSNRMINMYKDMIQRRFKKAEDISGGYGIESKRTLTKGGR